MGKRPKSEKKAAPPKRPRRSSKSPTRKRSKPVLPPPTEPAPSPAEPRTSSLAPADSRELLVTRTAAAPETFIKAKWKFYLLHPAGLLVGLGVGWQWTGMRTMVCANLDPSPPTVTMAAAIALILAAVGPRLPARFVFSLARLLRRRRGSRDHHGPEEGPTFWLLQALTERDESLLWLSLAVLSSAAGLLALLTLGLLHVAGNLEHMLLENFFWTHLTMSLLDWTLTAVAVGPAWLMNGLLAAALAPAIGARNGSRRAQPGIPGGILLGLGTALLLREPLADRGMSGAQEILLGALPMFALSVISVVLSQRAESRLPRQTPAETAAPELTGKAEGWIWASLAAWGVASALIASGWLSCQAMLNDVFDYAGMGLSGCLILVSLGVAAAFLRGTRENQTASDCGPALWSAGIAAGVTVVATAMAPAHWLSSALQAVIFAVPLGYALHCVERAWLARAGSETLGFAQMTTAVLGSVAGGLILTQWWIEPALGPVGTMTSGSLVLLAFGGLIQIHESDGPPVGQRRRLALVFTSLAVAIVLFPASAERWSRWTRSLEPGPGPTIAPVLPAWDLQHLRRICVVGLPPGTPVPGLDQFAGQIDWIPPTRWTPADTGRRRQADRVRILTVHALRMQRPGHDRYELVYARGRSTDGSARFPEYADEWLTRLANRTAAGGRFVLDVPLEDLTRSAVLVIAATFEHAARGHVVWRLVGDDQEPVLRLMTLPGSASASRHSIPPGEFSLSALLDASGSQVPYHSLRRDRLTGVLDEGAADGRSVADWLRSHHPEGSSPGRQDNR